jgi:hypothetical protein
METGDPDDFLTLLLLLGHPQVHRRAVTITPGSPQQVGVMRAALSWDVSLTVSVGLPTLEEILLWKQDGVHPLWQKS